MLGKFQVPTGAKVIKIISSGTKKMLQKWENSKSQLELKIMQWEFLVRKLSSHPGCSSINVSRNCHQKS